MLDHVVGIEVHPLAVTIAKATYLLALGAVAKSAKRPISIPVYMADSLFLPTEVGQMTLHDRAQVKVRFGNSEVLMPESFITSPELFDPALDAASHVAVDHARTKAETQETLRVYIFKVVPALRRHKESEKILEALWHYAEALARLIRERNNSIWAFIIRNSYRPAMLRRSFDVIVGNPPWLSYRYISDPDYQAEIKKRAVEDYRIAPNKQRLMTQMELATVFLAHSLGWFGAKGARLGFVMPRSILSGDQHENLRLRKYSWRCQMRLASYWDLKDVHPLFNVPACVLFADESDEPGSAEDALPVKEWSGKLDERDCAWSTARKQLSSSDETGRVIYLAKRCAFSTSSGASKPGKSGGYAKQFSQGATVVPQCFYFVQAELSFPVDKDRLYWVRTEELPLAKKPYVGVRLSGQVEGRFFYYTALARHVLPFVLLEPSTTVLPLASNGSTTEVWDAARLRREGHREFAEWMEGAERIWADKREKKGEQVSLYGWLDYQSKLTSQNLANEHIVLYNSTGTNVSVASVRRSDLAVPLIAEHTVYLGEVSGADEADYLASVLNSAAANEAIKPFQAMGLLGERHIEKKLMDLPIPNFKASDGKHRSLVHLGRQARLKATNLIKSGDLPTTLARQRGWIRAQLRKELEEIDGIVRGLL